MSQKPFKVSIVVPVYNAGRYITQCLSGLLSQTLSPQEFEVVLVNDGSTDDTLLAFEDFSKQWPKFPLRIVTQTNQGPAAARNEGIRHSQADIVAFLDADCVPENQWLEGLIAPFQNPAIDAVEGATLPENKPFTPLDHYIDNPKGGVYWTCNMAYRKPVLLSVGGFDEGFLWPSGEDIDIAHRIIKADQSNVAFASQAVVRHLILRRSFNSHVQRARTFSSMIRLWRKHPGLLIPADSSYADLLTFQMKHLLLPLVQPTFGQWLFRNPWVYLQLVAIYMGLILSTVSQLPRFNQEAHEPLVLQHGLAKYAEPLPQPVTQPQHAGG